MAASISGTRTLPLQAYAIEKPQITRLQMARSRGLRTRSARSPVKGAENAEA